MYAEKFLLKDQIAVVTGAGRGIGFEIARALGEAGATIAVLEIDQTNGREAVEKLTNERYRAELFPLDVTDSKAVKQVADAVLKKYGKVDVLVNNAGLAENIDAISYGDEEVLQADAHQS